MLKVLRSEDLSSPVEDATNDEGEKTDLERTFILIEHAQMPFQMSMRPQITDANHNRSHKTRIA